LLGSRHVQRAHPHVSPERQLSHRRSVARTSRGRLGHRSPAAAAAAASARQQLWSAPLSSVLERKQADVLEIRPYISIDDDPVVALLLSAWAPVFCSVRQVLGDEVFLTLYADWQTQQAQAVRDVIAQHPNSTWVAAADETPVGFVSATLHEQDRAGEIMMLAVDPDHQHDGIGLKLTNTAVAWMREQGVKLAVVETGGDPGHAPARAVYTNAGFTALPIARFFRTL
jgi:GNAT superfamily N-acetyltransferase